MTTTIKKNKVTTTRKLPSLWREILNFIIKIAVIGVILLLIFTFVYGLHRNSVLDMSPTVKYGDIIMFSRLDKNYSADSLAVLKYQGKEQVRRVIAKGGDTINITADGLVINGALQQELEICQKTVRHENGAQLPVTLEKDQVFLLGDARENAIDSRIYGPVNVKDTLGKVVIITHIQGT